MVVTIGNYEFLVKESYDGCQGCFYCKEPFSVCDHVRSDIRHQLPDEYIENSLGGCRLRNSILIENEPQSVLTYLEEKLNHD